MGKVSFSESFYGRLDFEGRACVNDLSGKGGFHCHGRTSRWPLPLPCVNTAWRNRSFLCHSHVGHQSMHSANERRGLQRDSLVKLNRAACPKAVSEPVWRLRRNHADGQVGCPSEGRPARQCLPCSFMLGYTGLNCQQSQGPGHAIAKHQRRFQGRGLQSFGGFVHRANCRFNADKNAPHFFRLTWR